MDRIIKKQQDMKDIKKIDQKKKQMEQKKKSIQKGISIYEDQDNDQ